MKTTDLVQQGLTAARVGDIEEAHQLFTQATEKNPDDIEAWLGLASVVESLERKKECFVKALEIEPQNEQAQAGLKAVQQKLEAQTTATESELTVCYRHPETETGLRCNRCNNPICPKCAARTPVGFRCPDCIREQENKYYTGSNADYIIAVSIAFPLSLAGGWLFTSLLMGLNFFYLTLLIAFIATPAVVGFIAEAVRWGVKKRRSRYLGHVTAGAFILAVLPIVVRQLFIGNLFGLLIPGIFLVVGTTTILARLK